MEENEKMFMSIEEIDAELEKEFAQAPAGTAQKEGTDGQPPKVEEPKAPIMPTEPKPTEPTDPQKPEETKPAKPTKDDQRDYNFAKLRSEKEEAEKKLNAQLDLMKKLAEASGYDSVDEYRTMLENRLIEEEAKKQGVTPELYKELSETKSKVQKLEQERKELDNQIKLETFSKEIAKVLQTYGLEDSVGDEIVKSFAEMGYTLETLLSVPHPEVLIKGVLSDKMLSRKAKEDKRQDRLDSVDTRTVPNADIPVKGIDELIEEEMVAYAKSRGLKYSK